MFSSFWYTYPTTPADKDQGAWVTGKDTLVTYRGGISGDWKKPVTFYIGGLKETGYFLLSSTVYSDDPSGVFSVTSPTVRQEGRTH